MLVNDFSNDTVSVFWFRRDLRLEDNTALNRALKGGHPVLPIFIFDTSILGELPQDDARVSFIYNQLKNLNEQLKQYNSSILFFHSSPLDAWQQLISTFNIKEVYFNKDYEPYAIKRDDAINKLLVQKGVSVFRIKDQVIFEENEVLKNDGKPYTVFTPYKRKWLEAFSKLPPQKAEKLSRNFYPHQYSLPTLSSLGFVHSAIQVPSFNQVVLEQYDVTRDIPNLSTSKIGPHLRFGTISIRHAVGLAYKTNATYLSELIWREFFMQILYHFPRVLNENFQVKYNKVKWRNNLDEFEKWKLGQTGYPLVDAGMRELKATGFMHNRVRMVVASFLCKHLLIDWRWGEAYFAELLLDYELASNNGNWQWAAGTGCDAAPYFRVFNPTSQTQKFDPQFKYVKKWVREWQTLQYSLPIVDHKFARERAIKTYKDAFA